MVTAKILGFKESGEGRGNIIIEVEYTLPDGSKVVNPYVAHAKNFLAKTPQEIQAWVQKQIEFQCERYLEAYGKAKVNDDLIKKSLNGLINSEYSRDKVIWKVTNKGEWITEQLDTSLLSQYVFVNRIEIDENGNITITEL